MDKVKDQEKEEMNLTALESDKVNHIINNYDLQQYMYMYFKLTVIFLPSFFCLTNPKEKSMVSFCLIYQ